MADTPSPETTLRQEAIRRHLQGEPIARICRDLQHSRRWFYVWWHRYHQLGLEGLVDRPRAPRAVPGKTPASVEHAIVTLRRELEAGDSPQTKYGLIGRRAIQRRLRQLPVTPVPSLATIQRTLARHGLTHRAQPIEQMAYYPHLPVTLANAVHATDIISRYLHGGQAVQNFHTLDLMTRAVHLTQTLDKTSATACRHLLDTWEDLGLPWVQQMDNEDCFRGGHTHTRVLGRVVRTCLYFGIEPLFIPFYEAKRNGDVEAFHGLWVQSFWSRQEFTNLEHVQQQVPTFLDWYLSDYDPPSLGGRTPAEACARARPTRLAEAARRALPDPVPVTAGAVHFVRKVDAHGQVVVLNQSWEVGKRWVGQYVWARVETGRQRLILLNQAHAGAAWKQIKALKFAIASPVHDLLPQFRRKRPQCPEDWGN